MRTIKVIISNYDSPMETIQVPIDEDSLQISQILNDEYGEDGWFCYE